MTILTVLLIVALAVASYLIGVDHGKAIAHVDELCRRKDV